MAPLALGAGLLVGGYVLLTRILGLSALTEALKKLSPIYPAQQAVADSLGLPEPDPVLGQWGNMWNDIANLFVSSVGKLYVALSHDSAAQGGRIGIAVAGLKPSTQFVYGWKELPQYNVTFTSRADGWWYGPGDIIIDFITAPGIYHIFADQRAYGGGYGEATFQVLAA